MPEQAFKEWPQPSLLDRLTDKKPDEPRQPRTLMDVVLRDLPWLLNAKNLVSDEELEQYPHVASSVLNYGLPDIAGISLAGLDLRTLEKSIAKAIIAFEPRIIASSLVVKADSTEYSGIHYNKIMFLIDGDMWGQHKLERLSLRAELDMERAFFSVSKTDGPA